MNGKPLGQRSVERLTRLFRDYLDSIVFADARLQPDEVPGLQLRFGNTYGSKFLQMAIRSMNEHNEVVNMLTGTLNGVSSEGASKEILISAQRLFESEFNIDSVDTLEIQGDKPLSGFSENMIADEVNLILANLCSQIKKRHKIVLIDEIRLEIPDLRIGNVAIYRGDSGPLAEHFKFINDDDRWYRLRKMRDELLREAPIFVKSYAVVEVEGDAEFANAKALVKLQDAAHILNFCLARVRLRYSLPRYKKIQLQGHLRTSYMQDIYEMSEAAFEDESPTVDMSGSTFGLTPYYITTGASS